MRAEDLKKFTVKELRQLASNRDVPNRSKLRRKTDLIQALVTAGEQAEASPAAVAPMVERSTDSSSAPAPASQLPQPSNTGQEPEAGLPIPPVYGQDRLVLMPQDPNHLFAYWELSGSSLEEARSRLGEQGAPVLILHGPEGSEQRAIDLQGGNYYLTVQANQTYEAELALRDSNGELVTVVRASAVTTPSDRPSEATGDTWMAVDEQFDELMLLAGLPQGSSGRMSEHAMHQRLWRETGVTTWSSDKLLGDKPPSSWSSPSSWSL